MVFIFSTFCPEVTPVLSDLDITCSPNSISMIIGMRAHCNWFRISAVRFGQGCTFVPIVMRTNHLHLANCPGLQAGGSIQPMTLAIDGIHIVPRAFGLSEAVIVVIHSVDPDWNNVPLPVFDNVTLQHVSKLSFKAHPSFDKRANSNEKGVPKRIVLP